MMPRPLVEPVPVVVVEPEPAPTNLVGVSGFVMSLVSLLTAGLLSPLAFLVSLIGLAWRPRQYAAMGVVISLMGCGLLAVLSVIVTTQVLHAQQRANAEARARLEQIAARPPMQGAAQLDPLIDQLESFSPEERERLKKTFKEGFTAYDDLLQDANGVPRRPSAPITPMPAPSPGDSDGVASPDPRQQ
jgi:hypothetical protein